MLPYSTIYIGTKYRTADSVSSSDFKLEPSETLTLPPNTEAYLTDITMVNTITTIIKDYNDKNFTGARGSSTHWSTHTRRTSTTTALSYPMATIPHRAWANTYTRG